LFVSFTYADPSDCGTFPHSPPFYRNITNSTAIELRQELAGSSFKH
jgi:hypothetical protein